jgi:hypothetical protein
MHLYTYVSEEGGDGEAVCSETPSPLSHTRRYVSFGEVDRVCRVSFREPMNLCTCVSEEGGDGEAVFSETPSLLSDTLRYVSFAEVGRVCRVALRGPMYLYMRERGGWGQGGSLETRPIFFWGGHVSKTEKQKNNFTTSFCDLTSSIKHGGENKQNKVVVP